MPQVLDHFDITVETEGNCQWSSLDVNFAAPLTLDSLANALAYCIMGIRCPVDSEHFKWWDQAVRGIRTNSDNEKLILTAYIRASLGIETDPLPEEQVQALVAETLWYEIVSNTQANEGLPIKVEEPHFTVTEPGGDGLAVYRKADGGYLFRLWEVKKHNSDSNATHKITKGSEQLRDNGAGYLAKWSKIEQEVDHTHPGLSLFYARLVNMWIAASPDAKAGISVTKKGSSSITTTPIASARAKLTRLVHDSQVEAMVISIPDFTLLASKVRRIIWNGI